MKLNIPLFLGIVDAHLAPFAKSKASEQNIRRPPEPAKPIRIYGKVYGVKEPEVASSW